MVLAGDAFASASASAATAAAFQHAGVRRDRPRRAPPRVLPSTPPRSIEPLRARGRGGEGGGGSGGRRRRGRDDGDARDGGFGAFDDDDDDGGSLRADARTTSSPSSTSTSPSTFFSRKSLSDPSFSLSRDDGDFDGGDDDDDFFRTLCSAAGISTPSRIQSLAWPPLLRGEPAVVVADQTGSGKTLAYLLPLLRRMREADAEASKTRRKRDRVGRPRAVILAPTAELADQIYRVCASLGDRLSRTTSHRSHADAPPWTFRPVVTTAAGSRATNIRDQIRLLNTSPVDVLVSTPGRLSTILRTRNAGLDLGEASCVVLDEVDFLLADETFGPQLRTVGAAVGADGDTGVDEEGGSGETEGGAGGGAQFVFVTATLPDDVLASIEAEFPRATKVKGPGLHRLAPSAIQKLVDVSVPPTLNKDRRVGFDIKVKELAKALRAKRCRRTLVFCNTVETCRDVENALRRTDRRGRRTRAWAYHNALSPE
ncbi:hypothetical protein ACHAWF_001050, partial [Thalassiosira exigua]